MTTAGSFEIDGSFHLTNRGLVIYGNIISGSINKNDYFSINNGDNKNVLRTKGGYLNKITEKITKIGLTFYYDNDKEKEALQTIKLGKQIATISKC